MSKMVDIPRIATVAFFFFLSKCSTTGVNAFMNPIPTAVSTTTTTTTNLQQRQQQQIFMASSGGGGVEFTIEEEDSSSTTKTEVVAGVEDKNGTPFRVGSVVRVSVENLKAFQVPSKYYGSFDDENKKLVPTTDDDEGKQQRYLVLPVGIRGVITKVFEKSKISANYPIQVQFTTGENTDEGYDPPVSFVMHFGINEVECV